MEQDSLALQMFLHGQYDRLERWLKNALVSPRNHPPRGTTPYSPPICSPLMAQSLWKNNGPHWKHLRGRPTIVLGFQDDRPENSPKGHFLDTKLAIEWGRRLKMQRNLFVVMRICSPVALSYLDAGFEPP